MEHGIASDLELPARCMCLDRFGRLSDVMENGMAPDFELPEVEGHLEDIHVAPPEADELQLDQDPGHIFSPAPAFGQGKPAVHMLRECLGGACWIVFVVCVMAAKPCMQQNATSCVLLPSDASDPKPKGVPEAVSVS